MPVNTAFIILGGLFSAIGGACIAAGFYLPATILIGGGMWLVYEALQP